jgi:hypothetical protein
VASRGRPLEAIGADSISAWARAYRAVVDARNAARGAGFYAVDGAFRRENDGPVVRRARVRAHFAGAFAARRSIRHELVGE